MKDGDSKEYGYRFCIYPTKGQTTQIHRTFGCCRFVDNYHLTKKINRYRTNKTNYDYNDCSADVTALKKALPWLAEVDSTALQSFLLQYLRIQAINIPLPCVVSTMTAI